MIRRLFATSTRRAEGETDGKEGGEARSRWRGKSERGKETNERGRSDYGAGREADERKVKREERRRGETETPGKGRRASQQGKRIAERGEV